MALVTVTFDTESVYSKTEMPSILEAFKEYIAQLDDDANVKSVTVTMLSDADAKTKKQDELFELLNSSGFTAKLSVTIPGTDGPYEVDMSAEDGE